MAEKVYLPDYLEKFANAYARDYVEEISGLDKGDSGYDKAFNSALQSFCSDYYESLTGIQSNPTSDKAREAFEIAFPVLFGDPRFLKPYIKDEKHAKILGSRFKGAIMDLTHMYLALVGGFDIDKGNNQVKKSMKYRKKDEGEKKLPDNEILATAKFRLKRSFIVMSLLSAITPVLRINPDTLDRLIDKLIVDVPVSKLNNKEFRNKFAKRILQPLINSFMVLKPLEIVDNYAKKTTLPLE